MKKEIKKKYRKCIHKIPEEGGDLQPSGRNVLGEWICKKCGKWIYFKYPVKREKIIVGLNH